jgi:tRNA threonylcarbamoyladenosine biosynthesis protein TsaB
VLILAVDSSTPVAGVALVEDHRVLNESFINYGKTHSETLLPTIDRIMRECDCKAADLDALAVTVGPGSFTGLRIGMATVKGMAMAVNKPVVALSTLDTLAANVWASEALIGALLDARKNELYYGFYRSGDQGPEALLKDMIGSPQDMVSQARQLLETGQRLILLGDGYYRYSAYFEEEFKEELKAMPGHLSLPRAAAAGILAVNKARMGVFEDPYRLRPVYIRLSEAEYRLGKGEM